MVFSTLLLLGFITFPYFLACVDHFLLLFMYGLNFHLVSVFGIPCGSTLGEEMDY